MRFCREVLIFVCRIATFAGLLPAHEVAAFDRPEVVAGGPVRGDCNDDQAVTLIDHRHLRLCLGGPGEDASTDCLCADFNGDGDVDLSDVAGMQRNFIGRAIPGSCVRGGGDCFEEHTGPGCNEVGCCQAVCESDSPCCNNTWDATCAEAAVQLCGVMTGPPNDSCAAPTAVPAGTHAFHNRAANTDGAALTNECASVRMGADVWFCHEADCDGFLIVSLCGSSFDSTVAVYDGCGCPVAGAVACNDDGCGTGLQSRLVIPVVLGRAFMIRVGGFVNSLTGLPDEGEGLLTLTCTEDPSTAAVCSESGVGCVVEHASPGCSDDPCCMEICEQDPFCCDVRWDAFCASEAGGFCYGDFPSCGPPNGRACGVSGSEPGCADNNCCQRVCTEDPSCCLVQWDSTCTTHAALLQECR